MNRKGLNHRIQVYRTTLLSLSQDANFSVEVHDLFIRLVAMNRKVGGVNIKNFYGNDLVAGFLTAMVHSQ